MNRLPLITGVLIALILKVCANNQTGIVRIVNGVTAKKGQFPFQIAIIADLKGMCSGSIINSKNALTAAHCCAGAKKFYLLMGTIDFDYTTNNFTRTTEDCLMHKNFNRTTLRHDIAILRFKAIAFTQFIQPIALPSKANRFNSYENSRAVASGWGEKLNGDIATKLQYITVYIISNDLCAMFFKYVFSTTLCARGLNKESTCQGDSGGPLYYTTKKKQKILIGIVSFGALNACSEGYPFSLTRVTKYLQWIKCNI